MKLRALVTLAAGLSLSTLMLACSADSGGESGNGGAPAQGGNTAKGGSANGGSGTGGSGQGGSGQGGSGQGGAANGGSGQGGSGQGGSGTGGSGQGGSSQGGATSGGSSNGGSSNGGSGQNSGGRGGSSSQGGGSPGAGGSSGTATFTQVAALLGMKCAGSMCHGSGSSQVNLVDMSGLYMRLTTPLANSVPHCKGTTLVVPKDANSFLAQIVKASASCMNSGKSENIAKMPDHCTGTGTNACLTDAQVKLISDWIAAGATQ